MYEPDGKVAGFRGVFCNAARNEAGSLDEVHTLFQRLDKPRDGRRIVFVVAIDGDDALVTFVQRKRIGTTQLSAQFAGEVLSSRPRTPMLISRSWASEPSVLPPSTMMMSAS